jgi:diapolycopene oxygenase
LKKVGIIGGGLGGLASACVLAARGYEVVVFERNEWLGGKAAVIESNGFRFDMGPTILTLPAVLDRIFAEAGGNAADALDLVRLDPQWRSFFEDGSTLDLLADTDAMASKLAVFSPGTDTVDGYRRFIGLSEQLHRISESYFFWRPVGGLRDMFDARATLQTNILRDVLAMPRVIQMLKAGNPDTVIMVGGAPLTLETAKQYGADGYAESAATAVQEALKLIELKKAVNKK